MTYPFSPGNFPRRMQFIGGERITFRDSAGIDSVAFLHDEEHQNFTSAVYRVVDLLPNARQRDLLSDGRIVKMDCAEAVPSRAPGLADSRLRAARAQPA